MPSVKNPNAPSKNRLAARANKQRKASRKAVAVASAAAAAGPVSSKRGVAKPDMRRGARPAGLLPTSGPRAPVSRKRQRKMERQLGYALKRREEEEKGEGVEGEVEMKNAAEEVKGGKKEKKGGKEEVAEEMDIE